jgi:uncharacterized membrane protein YhiD involved in acid resistance
MASTSVGTGQVIASTSIVSKVQSWQQTHGDNQQRNIADKQDDDNERKKEKVTESEEQDKVNIRQEKKKERERRKAKGKKDEKKKNEHGEDHAEMITAPRRIHVVA